MYIYDVVYINCITLFGPQQIAKNVWFKTTGTYSPTIIESSKCGQNYILAKSSEGEVSLTSSGSGGPWGSLAYRGIGQSLPVCTWLFLLCLKSPSAFLS